MRNIVKYKPFFALWVFACFAFSLIAKEDACCRQEYECGNPLNCGEIDFQVQAGIAPTLWTDRGEFSAISCNTLSTDANESIVPFFQMPSFNKLFKLPWIIGGHIGYALSDCFETYIEFNYRQGKHKDFELLGVSVPNYQTPGNFLNININMLDDYRVFDVYLAGRYYWELDWCHWENLSFFFGGKFGLLRRYQVNAAIVITSEAQPVPNPTAINLACVPFFLKKISPSGGLHAGFEWCLGCNFSTVFTAEVVATCGPRSNKNIAGINGGPNGCNILPAILPTNLIVGSVGSEVFFPITWGLKYSF